VRRELTADLFGARIGFEVVVAIRKAQPSLIDVGNRLRGVAQVGLRVEPEERVYANRVKIRDENRQFIGIDERIDGRQVVGERHESLVLDRRVVHARGVVVGGPLAIRWTRVGRRRFEDTPQDQEVALLDLREAADRTAIRRNRVLRDPAAARVLVEVGAGFGRLVERVQLHGAWRRGWPRALRVGEHDRQRNGDERQSDELAAHGSPSLAVKVQ
jgi:hypothetical protein